MAMWQSTIQRIANANALDVREIKPWHYRLMDVNGNYIFDIFCKMNKNKTHVVSNATKVWRTGKWIRLDGKKDFEKLLKIELKDK